MLFLYNFIFLYIKKEKEKVIYIKDYLSILYLYKSYKYKSCRFYRYYY